MKFRKTSRRREDLAPGEDSFLDVVANLVGVLLILLVVVGANAGSQMTSQALREADRGDLEELEQSLSETRDEADQLLNDHRETERQIAREDALASAREQERHLLLVRIAIAEKELESRKSRLDEKEQELASSRERIAGLERKRAEYTSVVNDLSRRETATEVIRHYPTPIVKTVFNEEIHFRLRGGRLVHVPMQELIELMKNEWKVNAAKLESADETLETVGPIGDFRLQYHLKAEEVTLDTGFGPMTRRAPQFNRFVLLPVSESIGTPVAESLAEGSEFRRRIESANPQSTTISIWVYPDSFAEFNELKAWLYERGFMTACWPLSANSPISGGPSGYRSTAQ